MSEITWPSPFGYTDFCDDVRHELFGKVTLVGVYFGEMKLNTPLPVVLPKLILCVHYFEKPTEGTEPLELNIYLPSDTDKPSQRITIDPRNHPINPDADVDRRAVMNFEITISPFVIEQLGSIRVRMTKGDDIVRLGALPIVMATEDDRTNWSQQAR